MIQTRMFTRNRTLSWQAVKRVSFFDQIWSENISYFVAIFCQIFDQIILICTACTYSSDACGIIRWRIRTTTIVLTHSGCFFFMLYEVTPNSCFCGCQNPHGVVIFHLRDFPPFSETQTAAADFLSYAISAAWHGWHYAFSKYCCIKYTQNSDDRCSAET